MTRNNEITVTVVRSAMVCSFEPNYDCIIIIIIYSLKIGAGQQGRVCGTYSCPQYKIKCRNIKYKRITENTITT